MLPGETWTWTLAGHTDLAGTHPGHYAGDRPSGIRAHGSKRHLALTDLTAIFQPGTQNQDLDLTMSRVFPLYAEERVCVSAWEHQESVNTRHPTLGPGFIHPPCK